MGALARQAMGGLLTSRAMTRLLLAVLFFSLVVVLLLGGCADDDKCDRIQADIDTSAGGRGLNGRTVCASNDPQVQKDFGSACNALKECEGD